VPALCRVLGAALVWMAAASVSIAQSPADGMGPGALGSLRVPGSTAALVRAAGLDPDQPRGGALLGVIRILYEARAGSDRDRDARVGILRSYLAAISGVERARAALPGGAVSAALATEKASRRAVQDAARALGGEIDGKDGVWRLVLRDDGGARRLRSLLRDAGLDAAAVARAFDGGSEASIALPEDHVPLPFDAAAWVRLVSPEPGMDGCLLTALLSDRRAALLYYGLVSLDAPTRAFLSANPELLNRLLGGGRPDVFATLGRSIRVRDGRMDVPGGHAAVALWEALLEQRVSEPASFILELLRRDGGRAALLYDALDHLDAPRQAFALALTVPEAGARIERFKSLYAAFGKSLAGLDLAARPFRRVAADGVHLLAMLRVLPSGGLPEPNGRRFWEAALSGAGVPSEPASELGGEGNRGPVDAAWLLDRLCVADSADRPQRVALFLFAQRAFAGLSPVRLPDALVALRAFPRYRVLLMTLERNGVIDPGIYAAAIRQAQRIDGIRDREKAELALRQFQGALALVERVRFSRALTAEGAGRLVSALAAVPLSQGNEYLGGIGAWLDDHFLPALASLPGAHAAPAAPDRPLESAVLEAMAGLRTRVEEVRVEWEGLLYRVDVGAAEFDRLSRLRRKQGGASLDAALALSRASRGLAGPLPGLSVIPSRIEALAAAADQLASVRPAASDAAVRLRQAVAGATRDLQKITKAKDLGKAARISVPLRRASDGWLADVLLSLAYTPHLGDPDGPALLAGDPALRHRFSAENPVAGQRATARWRIPVETLGEAGGWRATGSVLGLDVGLAALSLRRLTTDSLPPPPSVNEIDRSSIAATLVLTNAFDVTDAGRDALAGAIARGRARVEALANDSSGVAEVAQASGIGEWRRQILPWALRHEPARAAEYFSLSEFARLGSAQPARRPDLDAWGTSALAREGCLCLRYAEPGGWETLAGRFGTALVAEQMPDLTLRIAESLAGLGLPARLLPAVLAFVAQDVLDTCAPAHLDDWTALAAAVRRLPDSRIADDIAALTAGGPLVPADREWRDDARR